LSNKEENVKKDQLRASISEYGDAIVTYRSKNSNKQKYNVCTLDFNTEYISNKESRAEETKDTLLVWAWDTDSFRLLSPSHVVSVIPLSAVLRN